MKLNYELVENKITYSKPYNSNYPVVELKFDVFAYGVVALDLIIKD